MDAPKEEYEPPPKFQEVVSDPLLDISLTDSSELWLIQLPHQFKPSDFTGKQLSLRMHRDGQLASLENSSGKSFDMVSYTTQEPDATVILASSSEPKVVGKISRRVSLVRYELDADELERKAISHASLSYPRSDGLRKKSFSSGYTTPRSSRQRSSLLMSGTSFEDGEGSRPHKQRDTDRTPPSADSNKSRKRSSQASGGRSFDSSMGPKMKKIKVEE